MDGWMDGCLVKRGGTTVTETLLASSRLKVTGVGMCHLQSPSAGLRRWFVVACAFLCLFLYLFLYLTEQCIHPSGYPNAASSLKPALGGCCHFCLDSFGLRFSLGYQVCVCVWGGGGGGGVIFIV